MSLFPDVTFNVAELVYEQLPLAPTRTYQFDFEKGEFTRYKIDGVEATKQYIQKAIRTARYRYYMYTEDFGCEMDRLLGETISMEMLTSEATRMITDAILYDDRIADVREFQFTREGDGLNVNFTVVLEDGSTLTEGVKF